MNIKKAWLALWGKLEPVVIPGEANAASLYRVQVNEASDFFACGWPVSFSVSKYFHTCEQAFAAHPGKAVQEVFAFRVGDRWFIQLTGIEVHPGSKPNVPKGKRKPDGRS